MTVSGEADNVVAFRPATEGSTTNGEQPAAVSQRPPRWPTSWSLASATIADGVRAVAQLSRTPSTHAGRCICAMKRILRAGSLDERRYGGRPDGSLKALARRTRAHRERDRRGAFAFPGR